MFSFTMDELHYRIIPVECKNECKLVLRCIKIIQSLEIEVNVNDNIACLPLLSKMV